MTMPTTDADTATGNTSTLLLFVVYKQGMCGHGVHGIDVSLDKAIAMADEAARLDVDDYHSYDVYEIPAGAPPVSSKNKRIDYGWMNNEPVYSVQKNIELS